MRETMLRLAVCVLALAGALGGAPALSHADGCKEVAVNDPDSGIGGTGFGEDDSGVGGTGFGDPDSGIGGTGFGAPDSGIGGTGVFGTITGFASICVNGLEVHYAPDVSVTWNGAAATAQDLAIGHVVWIVAEEEDDELVARSIEVSSALIGSVDRFDVERGALHISGESVAVTSATRVFGNVGGEVDVDAGTRVEISGLRRADGRIVASRIDRTTRELTAPGADRSQELVRNATGLRRLSLEGFVEAGAAARMRVAGVEVDTRGIARPEMPSAGSRVRVSGTLRDGVLRADRIVSEHPGRIDPARPLPPTPTPAPPDIRPPDVSPPDVRPPDVIRPERFDRPDLPQRPDVLIRPLRPDAFERPRTP